MFEFKDVGYITDGEIDLILEKKVPAIYEKFYVPSYHFKVKKHLSNVEMGKIDIRIGHNENTFYGGNIGYEIYPMFQGNHYAAKACQLIKKVALMHQLTYLYISCLPENIPSNKTCLRLQAQFLGTYQIPFHSEMYLIGLRQINVYYWSLVETK
ncbi:MAG TPA: GNAT family N-acetyltransferase [Firmicutes bacterium]|nr:GNAT family N-acetyltransferase [Bacillota bacterium]